MSNVTDLAALKEARARAARAEKALERERTRAEAAESKAERLAAALRMIARCGLDCIRCKR